METKRVPSFSPLKIARGGAWFLLCLFSGLDLFAYLFHPQKNPHSFGYSFTFFLICTLLATALIAQHQRRLETAMLVIPIWILGQLHFFEAIFKRW